MALKKVLENIPNPPAAYRGKPFWAWNGKIEPETLRRQIRIMRRMGLGGAFMHSRIGLATPYLSREWFDCINACIDEAKKQGMEMWLYDEDRWPSGAAGGLVTKDPRYRARYMHAKLYEGKPQKGEVDKTCMLFAVKLDDGNHLVSYRRLKGNNRSLERGERVASFRVLPEEPSSWYNGATYLDTLNPEAVKRFIKVTYERYLKENGKHFGKTVPGIFTDEPNYGYAFKKTKEGTAIPWTESLPEVFEQRYGYDILERLPEVFWGAVGEDLNRVRYHYFDCITWMFTKAFAEQIGKWCGKHGLLFTGHVLCEELPSPQTHVIGSAMRFYEHMQAPGMDILTEYRREYDTAKQVASVARQFGRKWRLTETYGCTGWDFSFAGHKAVGDWQAAFGINLRCQHLSWYTMEGEAKRDYPASIFYQSPWWHLYPKVEDYFARVNAVLSEGKEIRDIAVIYPVESAWTMFDENWQNSPDMARINASIVKLRDRLLEANLDFDYLDEDILARHGSIRRKGGSALLRINKADYRVVIVPPLLTVRKTTIDMLRRFKESGGTVIFVGDPPAYVDALPSEEARETAASCVRVPENSTLLSSVLEPFRRVSIRDKKGKEIPSTLYQLREDGDSLYLFVCNTGHNRLLTLPDRKNTPLGEPPVRERNKDLPHVYIHLAAEKVKDILEIDAESGTLYRVDHSVKDGEVVIKTSLPPLASRIFVFSRKKIEVKAGRRPTLSPLRKRTIKAPWEVSLDEPNVLVLDRLNLFIDGKLAAKGEEVLRADRVIRKHLGIPPRGGRMKQPWAQGTPKNPPSCGVELVYTVRAKHAPSGGLFLALERPELYTVEVNGIEVPTEPSAGWWVDESLRLLPVDPALLRKGENSIRLRCTYSLLHPGLEMVYLLGDFGVKLRGTEASLTEPVHRLNYGDWCKQGLPFYAGNVTYRKKVKIDKMQDGDRLFVEVPSYRGTAVRVLVDGRPAGIIAWPPNEVDITDMIGEPGTHEIGIEVMGHRRNSHGPLHLSTKHPIWTGPTEFVTSGEEWRDDYNLVECGLIAPVNLVWKSAQ